MTEKDKQNEFGETQGKNSPEAGEEQETTVDVQVLNPGDRDNFEGITIEDGNAQASEKQEKPEETFYGTKVYQASLSGGSSWLWQLLAVIIAACFIFILLPAFLLVFLSLAVVYYLIRLFR